MRLKRGAEHLVVDAAGNARAFDRAVELLQRDGIVAFPTETVYGLGASIGRVAAIRKVFAAKGRPAGVPLIAHVTGWEQARGWIADPDQVGAGVRRLVRELWPGPLTLVFRKAERVPREATGGGDTVGVRAPDHPVAQELLERLGVPIMAPSANRFGELPPVTAGHVLEGLGNVIDAVLDGGACPGGLESTVVDVTSMPARILRAGAIPRGQIANYIPLREADDVRRNALAGASTLIGSWLSVMPRARLQSEIEGVVAGSDDPTGPSGPVAVLWFGARGQGVDDSRIRSVELPVELRAYASGLYDRLHALRSAGVQSVWLEAPPEDEPWEGVWARLRRLSSGLGPVGQR